MQPAFRAMIFAVGVLGAPTAATILGSTVSSSSPTLKASQISLSVRDGRTLPRPWAIMPTLRLNSRRRPAGLGSRPYRIQTQECPSRQVHPRFPNRSAHDFGVGLRLVPLCRHRPEADAKKKLIA
jgi:hypothetical protein